jgi:hypothetical protein
VVPEEASNVDLKLLSLLTYYFSDSQNTNKNTNIVLFIAWLTATDLRIQMLLKPDKCLADRLAATELARCV